jgi:hypothetical protein
MRNISNFLKELAIFFIFFWESIPLLKTKDEQDVVEKANK